MNIGIAQGWNAVVKQCIWLLTLGVLTSAQTINAQDSLALTETPLELSISDTALLVVGRRDEAIGDLPYVVEIVKNNAIQKAQSLSTVDALAELSGVYVQKSQFGGGSPVLRGFEANRVLLVVDGVRMNNAIYRAGHLQNAITISPLALDRMEVIYGAGALAYGSDAIGGIVHFRTQQPPFRAGTQDAMNGQMSLNFTTAARATTLAGKLTYGAAHWAGLTLLTATSTSHLRAGAHRPEDFPDFGLRTQYFQGNELVPNDRPNRQVGTAYSQYDLLQKFRFRLGNHLELSANFQLSTSSDIPRYDALIERREGQLRWARWDYGPQTRLMGALRLQDRRPTLLYNLANYLISHQFIKEDRITRRAGDLLEENNLEEVHAINFQTDFTKTLRDWTLNYGLDLRYDAVSSIAFLNNILSPTDQLPRPSTRYPSEGASLAGGGFYLEAKYPLNAHWQFRGGLRYSRQWLSATFGSEDPIAWPQPYLDGIANTEGALTSALGLRYQSKQHRWRFLLAQGFRTPNIDDFAKFREANGRIQVP
ncbi:MAG: TonB-dependent receptor, partial [Bacteroidota bacterium]